MKNGITKHLLFYIVLFFLFSPIVEEYFKPIDVKPLSGAIDEISNVKFRIGPWFNGEYQKQKEKYLNQHFGFRNICIRANNQLAFNFWKKAKANGVIIGKHNYLYEENYIKAYYGKDFTGESKIEDKVNKIKFLQDTLKKLNIDFLIVFAAGKGSFFPEFIPKKFQSKKSETNLECYLKHCKNQGINFIDFNSYFINIKNNSKYPLFPQYGIHWSSYGWCLAADSIIRCIENFKKIDMPDLIWKQIDFTAQPRDDDYDIAAGMNLLFNLPTFKMGYPKLIFETNPNKIRPNVLTIADSYYWQMFNAGIPKEIFNNGRFWFYNKQIYPDSYDKPITVSEINLKKEIEKQDVIMILGTEATLPDFGWGFIESAYKVYTSNFSQDNAEYEKKIADFENSIRNTPEWLSKVNEKANNNNISLDSMIHLDAIWMVEHENKK